MEMALNGFAICGGGGKTHAPLPLTTKNFFTCFLQSQMMATLELESRLASGHETKV